MFGLSKEKEQRMNFLQNFTPTSKMQLLQVCMWYNKGDTKKAQEMFDFYANNVTLPDVEPIPPTWQQNTANTVNSFLSWFKENQDTLVQGYDFIRSVIAKRNALPEPVTPIPPINE